MINGFLGFIYPGNSPQLLFSVTAEISDGHYTLYYFLYCTHTYIEFYWHVMSVHYFLKQFIFSVKIAYFGRMYVFVNMDF